MAFITEIQCYLLIDKDGSYYNEGVAKKEAELYDAKKIPEKLKIKKQSRITQKKKKGKGGLAPFMA